MLLRRKLNNCIDLVLGGLAGICLFYSVSCTHSSGKKNDAVVQTGKHILTRTELDENLPPFLTPEDSILAAEHFIRIWINDHLLYDIAQKNIADKNAIEQLVENYRRSLTIYQYQEQLVNEKIAQNIREQELQNYYEDNKEIFKLDKPLIKGLFLRVPLGAPHIDKAKSWCKKPSPVFIDNLEKYSVQNAANFDFFENKWVDFNELMHTFPNPPETPKKQTFYEREDLQYYYFLNVSECLLPGDNAPFQFAEPTVKEFLINRKRIEFLRKTENDIYNKALNSGQIIFYNE